MINPLILGNAMAQRAQSLKDYLMKKLTYLISGLLLSCGLVSAVHAEPILMPVPTKMNISQGSTTLNASLDVYIAKEHQAVLQPLLVNSLFAEQFTQLNLVEAAKAQLQINVKQGTKQLPYLGMDESYKITIADNRVTLKSVNQYGMLRGLASLSQLLFSAERPRELTNLTITDKPTYPWRGLLFDSVRHFLPIVDVKRTLRGLASAKFNVFHWHLTDDQGWRIELNSYPKLHQQASDGLYYTQAQIKDVVQYAAKLGIRVVPEFDVPGHASAIVLAYPELGSGTKLAKMERRWGVFKPLLDPSNPKVYKFVDDVVKELAGLFPDQYLHIGGDEIDDTDWQANSDIQAYMRKKKLTDSYALHAYFNQRVAKILAKYNKKMIGWDEVLHPSLPKNTLVQSWRGHHSLAQIREQGYHGILSSGFYIDQPHWTSYHYRNHPQPLVKDSVVANTLLGSVNFTLTRLKGSAVTGQVDLFNTPENDVQARVEIAGKGQFISQNVQKEGDVYQVKLDTWMGATTLFFTLQKTTNIAAMIGNTAYQFNAQENVTSTLTQLNEQLTKQQQRVMKGEVLGGEATAWAEMITTENLDTRLWPRLYAIGERFWSSPSVTDEEDMYRRLSVMNRYADETVGLLHQQQLVTRLKEVLKTQPQKSANDLTALLTFSQLIEPVHYYTLNHLAFLRGEYHQQAPLDKLLNVLPVESLVLKQFDYDVDDYKRQCDEQLLASLQSQLVVWQQLLESKQSLFMNLPQWQASYLAILDALDYKNELVKQPSVNNDNGTITQVIASINHLKRAQQSCRAQ